MPRAHQPQLFHMLFGSHHSRQRSTSITDIPEPSEGAETQMTHVSLLPVVTLREWWAGRGPRLRVTLNSPLLLSSGG